MGTKRGAVGRRDLLCALESGALEARQLGFQRTPDPGADQAIDAKTPTSGLLAETNAGPGPELPPGIEPMPPIGPKEPTAFWRASHLLHVTEQSQAARERQAEARQSKARLTIEDFEPVGPPPPTPPPIAAWGRVRRALDDVLSRPLPLGDIDIDRHVERITRGQPIMELPRRPRRSRVPRLIVIVDCSARLTPFWEEQDDAATRVIREFGSARSSVVWWDRGPPWWMLEERELVSSVAAGLDPGDVVLVIGDLGCHGSGSTRYEWARLGRALRRREVVTAALVNCPSARWPTFVSKWRAIDWSSPMYGLRTEAPAATQEVLDERRDRLLALLSWTVLLEPALLRSVRARMSASDADVGTEADVWTVEGARGSSGGLRIPDDVRVKRRAQLRMMLQAPNCDPETRALMRDVVNLVRRHHLPVAREVWLSEALTLDSLDPDGGWIDAAERSEIAQFIFKLRRELERREQGDDIDPDIGLSPWGRRFMGGRRVSDGGWTHREWGLDLAAACVAAHRNIPNWTLPEGLTREMLPRPIDPPAEASWVLAQTATGLSFEPGSLPSTSASPLLIMRARARELLVGRTRHSLSAREHSMASLPDVSEVVLATDCMEVVLTREPRPSWAVAAGRDRFGLWATFRVAEVEQRMRWIPPGRFMMGSPEAEEGRYKYEGPQHEVTISQGFWMAETPCTQALWEAVMGDNPSHFLGATRPVEQVSFEDVQGFLHKIAAGQSEIRLPTEPEWEYACRAGSTGPTYAPLDAIAWYSENSDDQTHEVGGKLANAWGLHDMLGNVWEWCDDGFAPYPRSATADRSGRSRVYRGGSWGGHARRVRAASRSALVPGGRDGRLGFRLVRGQEQQEQPSSEPSKGAEQGRGTRPASARRKRSSG